MSPDEWDQPQKPKGSCARCGRLTSYVMGERGPVKTPLTMTSVGYFRFCADCLAEAAVEEKPYSDGVLDILRIGTESWITGHRP